jgi:N-acetylneuraminic acid mutarotase
MDVQRKSWVQVIGNGTTNAPFARGEFTNGMLYDRQHDRVVLFGGRCMDKRCTKNASLNDTWVYDLFTNTWTRMSPPVSPPRRANHMMAYDSVNNVTVLFGGRDESGVIYGDLWIYDYENNQWTELFPAESPSARRMGSLVYDPDQNLFVLYGGGAKSGLRDVWILRLQDVCTSPPPD